MSINTRISLLLIIVCGCMLFYFTNAEIEETHRRYREATEEPLVDVANLLSVIVSAQQQSEELDTALLKNSLAGLKQIKLKAKIYDLEKNSVDLRVYVANNRGLVIYDSENGRDEGKNFYEWNDVFNTLAGKYGARSTTEKGQNLSTLYVAAPVYYNNRIIGSLTVAKSNHNANQFILAAQRNTKILALILFFILTLVSLALAFVVTKPLAQFTNYVRSIRDGNPLPSPKSSVKELKVLGQTFEEMRDAVEGKKYIERYVKTLTHELKSPITAIQASIEVLSEEIKPEERARFLSNIKQETSRIQNLAERLVSLSSLQSVNTEIGKETFLLSELLEEISRKLKPYADSKEIKIELDNPDKISINANYFWISEALINLIQNAIDFSENNSIVRIKSESTGKATKIIIKDSGSGIPEWAADKIFDQFFSLARPSTGKRSSGLGLSLVKEIVQLHQGEIEIFSKPGDGTTAIVTLNI